MTQLTFLFDLDGTLADTAPDIALALDAMLVHYGLPAAGFERARDWIGGGAPLLLKRALAAYEQPHADNDIAEAMRVFMPLYAKYNATKAMLFPGVAKSLATLESRGATMAIVTNKPFEFAQSVLETLKIDRFFPVVIGGDSLPVKKPSPEPLYAALAQLGQPAGSSWMIGDSATDITAARNAGIRSAWVPYGYNQNQTAAELSPDQAFEQFADILDLS